MATLGLDITQDVIDYMDTIKSSGRLTDGVSNNNWTREDTRNLRTAIKQRTGRKKLRNADNVLNIFYKKDSNSSKEYVRFDTLRDNLSGELNKLENNNAKFENLKREIKETAESILKTVSEVPKQVNPIDKRNKKTFKKQLEDLNIENLTEKEITQKLLNTNELNSLRNLMDNINTLRGRGVRFAKHKEIITKANRAIAKAGSPPPLVTETGTLTDEEEGEEVQVSFTGPGMSKSQTFDTPEVDPEEVMQPKQKKKKKKAKKTKKAKTPSWTFQSFKNEIIKKTTGNRYLGSGTPLIKHLQNKVKPTSSIDRIAMEHDIRYTLATTEEEINEADELFIERANSLFEKREFKGIGDVIASALSGSAITFKTLIDQGPLSRTEEVFVNFEENRNIDPQIKEALEDIRDALVRKNKNSYLRPGDVRFIFSDDMNDRLIPEEEDEEEDEEGDEEDDEEDDEEEDEEEDEEPVTLDDQLQELNESLEGKTDEQKQDFLARIKTVNPDLYQAYTESLSDPEFIDEADAELGDETDVELPLEDRLMLLNLGLEGTTLQEQAEILDKVREEDPDVYEAYTKPPESDLRVTPHPSLKGHSEAVTREGIIARQREEDEERNKEIIYKNNPDDYQANPVPNSYLRPMLQTGNEWVDYEKLAYYGSDEMTKIEQNRWYDTWNTPFQYGEGDIHNKPIVGNNIERLAKLEHDLRYNYRPNSGLLPNDYMAPAVNWGRPMRREGRIPERNKRWKVYNKLRNKYDMNKYQYLQRQNQPPRTRLMNREAQQYKVTRDIPTQQRIYDEFNNEPEQPKLTIKNDADYAFYKRLYVKSDY
ncbi:MAG: hypothetical protein HKM26_08320 [Winogradskyella sp.]|nr:hypothetical protein [Winogradskyella sp.]